MSALIGTCVLHDKDVTKLHEGKEQCNPNARGRKEGRKESLSVFIGGSGSSRSIARSIDVWFLLDCLEFDVESWVGGDMRAC